MLLRFHLFLSFIVVLSIPLLAQQSAYNGPNNIPGIIEAENFDAGGEGVAYHDNEPGQVAAVSDYRTATDPDVEVEAKADRSNGHIIGWTKEGEWYEYTITATEADNYIFYLQATGRNVNTKGFRLLLDEVAMGGDIELTPASDWFSDWQEYEVSMPVTAGDHVLRLEIFSDSEFAINVDYIRVVSASEADDVPLSVTSLINNNAVLQRNELVNVWGKGNPGNEVSITPEWADPVTVTVAEDSTWRAKIATGEAGGPYTLSVADATRSFNFNNLLLGEVWLCAGQSNMAMPMQGWGAGGTITNAEAEIAAANFPDIRQFDVRRDAAYTPLTQVTGGWRICDPTQVRSFSATAYFFARELHQELNVPVGVIVASRGDSKAQAWTNAGYLTDIPGFENLAAELISSENGNGPYTITNLFENSQFNAPGTLFNGTIAPLLPYTIKGFIWYQGETDSGNPEIYREVLGGMIQSWRDEAGIEELPFHFVQITPLQTYDNNGTDSEELREAQFFVDQDLANTEMAVGLDAGDQFQIHPSNKQAIGKRLGLAALKRQYGQDDLVYTGPIYTRTDFNDGKAFLNFELNGSALSLTGPGNFEIAGRNGNFVPATASINGDQIEVFAAAITEPTQVRYAWANWMEPSLFNTEGLPSSSFSTYTAFLFSDDFMVDQETKVVSLPSDATAISIADFLGRIAPVSGASPRVVNAAGEDVTNGTLLGTYSVIVTMDNGQDERTYTIAFNGTTPTIDPALRNLEIYPNPLANQLTLHNLKPDLTIRLVSLAGKLLHTQQSTGTSLSIDTSSLPAGAFLLLVEGGGSYRLIKE